MMGLFNMIKKQELAIYEKEKIMKTWFVYILECLDGSYYTGVSNNVTKRMKAHEKGTGSKYVKKKGFKKLLLYKKCLDKSDACKKEYQIKQLPKYKKLDWFKKII
jgi:putative endonuclease